MSTVIGDMLGGFVNGCISPQIFERHFYSKTDDYEKALDKNTFDMLVYLDYGDENDVAHIRRLLGEEYPAKEYNDAYFQSAQDEEIKQAYALSQPDLTTLVIELKGIKSADQLHNVLKRALHLPEWFGHSWAAFEDLIDLSACKSITVNSYGDFYQQSPKDAMLLIWQLSKHKTKDCLLTVNN